MIARTPALNGETVTQGDADACATGGHLTHTHNGRDTGICPRCGEVTESHPVATDASGEVTPVDRWTDAELMTYLEADVEGMSFSAAEEWSHGWDSVHGEAESRGILRASN